MAHSFVLLAYVRSSVHCERGLRHKYIKPHRFTHCCRQIHKASVIYRLVPYVAPVYIRIPCKYEDEANASIVAMHIRSESNLTSSLTITCEYVEKGESALRCTVLSCIHLKIEDNVRCVPLLPATPIVSVDCHPRQCCGGIPGPASACIPSSDNVIARITASNRSSAPNIIYTPVQCRMHVLAGTRRMSAVCDVQARYAEKRQIGLLTVSETNGL